jgi:mannose-1-phosphate guanylyltransferase
MVLCAGLGTRLRPLTEELPKPALPVGDRPILAHIARSLKVAGLSRIVINTHHLPDAFLRILESLEIEAQVVHEPEILGTAGGVAGARHAFGPAPILVWNGDILAEPPIAELFAAAGDGLALAVTSRPAGEGTVGLGADRRVVRLRGEIFGEEASGGDYIGVAALGERCLAELPERGCLIGDVALPMLRSGAAIPTVEHAGDFVDIGDLGAYLEANRRFIAQSAWGEGWVAEDAEVDRGVRVVGSVVGSRARVTGEGKLESVVVWPGAEAHAPLSNAIVTTGGKLVRVR